MVLITPRELERIKKMLHDFCKNEFVGQPVDNIGPYDFNLDSVKPMTDEEKKEFKKELKKAIEELTKDKRKTLFDILEENYDDVLEQYDANYLGTFAKFKKEDNDGNKEPN